MLDNGFDKLAQPMAVPHVLCVDLDGTLLRSDVLLELALAAVKTNIWQLMAAVLILLRHGKARFKAALTEGIPLDVTHLPYDEQLLDYLRAQKAKGRLLVLATATNRGVADRIARHLGLFDAVVASDEVDNLRGQAKAERLIGLYGEKGFGYAGNDSADIPVWKVATSAVVVGAGAKICAQIPCRIEASLERRPLRVASLARALRLHQWVKNLLLFLPLATSNAILNLHNLVVAAAAFLCFGVVASGVYVINDLLDLEADRRHSSKRHRPLASGALSLQAGIVIGPALAIGGTLAATAVSPSFGAWMMVYVVVSSAYTGYLKTVALLDAFTLSGLYMLRVVAGGVVTGFPVSVWLMNFAGFFFLSLAFIKRYVELSRNPEATGRLERRGYSNDDAQFAVALGLASAFSACIVLGLYVDSKAAHAIYGAPAFIWGLVPLVLYWECRMWLLALRNVVDDDPILFAVRDRGSWVIAGLAVLCYLMALSQHV